MVDRLQTCGELAEFLTNVCEARCFGRPWEAGNSDWNVQRVLNTLNGSESTDDNDLANILIRCCSYHDLNLSMFISRVIEWLRFNSDHHITRPEPLSDEMTTLPPGSELTTECEWSDVPAPFSVCEGATLADWKALIDTCLGRSGSALAVLRVIVGSGELCFQVKDASRSVKVSDTP